jgi:tetratricopeptide (TPR) repeat protein
MIAAGRYTSGAIAVANLSSSIDSLELRRRDGARFVDLVALSKLLFLRGDLLGRIVDHHRAELVANDAVAASADTASALFERARLGARFHRFKEAGTHLDRARAGGYNRHEIDSERAGLLQATGHYSEALSLREALAKHAPGIATLTSLASLLAEMDEWAAAETCYRAALRADEGLSPIPGAQLLFEWAIGAMRRRDLDHAEMLLAELEAVLPSHVPGRGHRAEVALGRGYLDAAMALVAPLVERSDDPEYRATYAEVLAARGEREAAASQVARAAADYERLLARHPEAYADHAADFFMGIGNRPQRAVDLAALNFALRDTPRSRRLLARARRGVVMAPSRAA